MNKSVYVLALCIVSTVMSGKAQHRVEITITGIRDTAGVVMVGLFTDGKSFMKKPAVGKRVKAVKGEALVVLEDLPAGEYAVSVIHDANRNGKLDTNFMGMPREGFGFSNDAVGTFGPPAFEKAKFKVTSAMHLRITTRYL